MPAAWTGVDAMTSMTIRSRTLIAVCLAGLLGGGAAVA